MEHFAGVGVASTGDICMVVAAFWAAIVKPKTRNPNPILGSEALRGSEGSPHSAGFLRGDACGVES